MDCLTKWRHTDIASCGDTASHSMTRVRVMTLKKHNRAYIKHMVGNIQTYIGPVNTSDIEVTHPI